MAAVCLLCEDYDEENSKSKLNDWPQLALHYIEYHKNQLDCIGLDGDYLMRDFLLRMLEKHELERAFLYLNEGQKPPRCDNFN